MTGADGRFSIDLPEGTYAVRPQTPGTVFPVAGADCTIQGYGCSVVLDRDRVIAFTGCVIPDPGGGKLPPSTPDPIPGAVIRPPLEAVGCWAPQNGGPGADPTIYTTTRPVRLTYHGGAAAAPVSVDDLGAGSASLGFTRFGVPIQTSGGPAGFLPVQETTGQTVCRSTTGSRSRPAASSARSTGRSCASTRHSICGPAPGCSSCPPAWPG